MIYTRVKITGIDELSKRAEKMASKYNIAARNAARDALDTVAQRANLNLLRKIGAKRTPRGHAGHGDPLHQRHLADSRDDMSSWIIDTKINGNVVTAELTNICEHAAAVEFGVKGTITPKHGNYMVLGYHGGVKSYETAILREEVKGQEGYGFLQQVLDNQRFMHNLQTKIKNSMSEYLVSV